MPSPHTNEIGPLPPAAFVHIVMPQITLEYSENCQYKGELRELFHAVHNILQDTGGILLDNCKSRARRLSDYYIADGDNTHAFAHLEIRFIEGRSHSIRASIGNECLDLLKDFFEPAIDQQRMQITVEVDDIKGSNYYKYPPGTLTPQ